MLTKSDDSNDILVVGGGPAGLTAARVAANLGAKVLLLEKKSYLGSPFPRCMWESPYMRRVFKAIGNASIRTPVHGIRVYDIDDIEYQEVPTKGWGANHVDAIRFCQGLARLAAEAGARMEVNRKVSGFIKDGDAVVGVHTSRGKYRSRVVLCADGLASIHIGLAKGVINSPYPEKPMPAVNTELVGVSDIEPGWQEYHPWGSEFNLGRQTLLPLDKGFCGATFHNLEHFRLVRKGTSTLSKKLRNAQIAKLFAVVDREMRGKPLPNVAFDGLLFCGEAAGNHYALHCMISAEKAAQIATSAVNENNVKKSRLAEYEVWQNTSLMSQYPGRTLSAPTKKFDLTEHCKQIMARQQSISKVDI